MIRLEGVRVAAGERTVLHELDLELAERRIAVVGANGSGKSTFVRLLNGLVLPSAGAVSVDGVHVERHLDRVRRQVGFVFTDPDAQLVMPTPAEDVELSLRRAGVPARQRRARALQLLAEHGLQDHADVSVRTLSSGQRQLLALTAVLATGPAVLVCDEPTTLLDLRHGARVAALLLAQPAQLVVATHHLELAAAAERALWIDAGRVVADGPAAAVVAAYRAHALAGTGGAGPGGPGP
ncbi:ABC transporter ATP-binding protein [Kineococcus glutinatus]|uniref:ABC transporter domain-containing protein n=1 Tax=Kineococcus glutinatus TaxID=1070872 RepID=A0ABP8VCX1_9ACTN